MDIFSINMVEIFDVLIRGLLSLLILFFVTKLLGKKQVSQLSLFDYVIGISIGNFAAELTINLESHTINGILAVVLFGVIAYGVSYMTMKSITARRFFMGTPTILIQNGKIVFNNLKKLKCDLNDMFEQLRTKGFFDISQIEFAIMEANGEISILPKAKYRPLNPNDMKLKVSEEGLVANVVLDGKIMKNNLDSFSLTEEWLLHELKIKGYTNIDNLLLVCVDVNKKLKIYEKTNIANVMNVLE